jgi:imidazole glycerol phosphate synthase subunit HisF
MRRAFCSLAVLALAVSAARAEDVANPEFASWAKHKKGTSITMKTVTSTGGMNIEILATTTLLEVGADKVTVETATVSKINGMEFKAPGAKREIAKTVTVPGGTPKVDPKAKPPGTVEDGTETVKVGGVEIKAKWFKAKVDVAGNKTESKTWMSDDVPGLMVKMEATTTGAATSSVKMELIEFKKP